VASDTSSRTKPYAQGGTPLSLAVKWPTPTVCGNYNRKGASATSGDGLATAVYQTPVARMWKDNGKNPSELERNSPTLAMRAGGSLNPTWVEWLMGWPLGWTDLKPLATDKSPYAPPKHSESLPETKTV
jgi:DNA (cytosine-5)-methyltransferase 1